ncbi:Ger(x)C family spore germination protein [Bacillus cereus]|uniref:Ger(x)C family spore germination protein n=1 Tax=Bacillus cereus TaxID=1396 RepID=UPI000BEB6FC4|nr:Ger(x)C family spore germination protein [Bacillus cereus]PEF61479.1 spore gernimation protein GerC [Bacillus cereus]
MNSIFIKIFFMIGLSIFLTGCWKSKDLTDYAFVMGLSLDQTDKKNIELTAQIYAPTQTIGGTGSSKKSSYFNIKMYSDSILDAARSFPLHLGRKAQWGHMCVLLISEQFAKKQNIGEALEFFYRDHESRLTLPVIITRGKADVFLKKHPFIEQTISQQLLTTIQDTSSGKIHPTTLLDIGLQLNSKVKTTMIPYIEVDNTSHKAPYSNGVAIIYKGKLVNYLNANEVQNILMLRNDFKSGSIEFPCINKGGNKKGKKETLEILSIKTKIAPQFIENPPTIRILTKIEGVVGELRCTSITTKEDEKKLENQIEKLVKIQIEKTIKKLQKEKIDALEIGNKLYQQNPNLWKKHEKNWGDMFSTIRFAIDVEVTIKGTGEILGKKVTEE